MGGSRSSKAKATGSDLRARGALLFGRISYLYSAPLPSPGMKISQSPLPGWRRIGCTRPSQPFQSPTALTRRAFGAQTANRTPVTPSTVARCAPSFS